MRNVNIRGFHIFVRPGVWILAILCASAVLGQPQQACVLDGAKNGDLVKFRGEALNGGHDALIRPFGCETSPDERIVLTWADDSSLGAAKTAVRRDAALSNFNRLFKETAPLPPNAVGLGEPRYRVVADFEGKLEVAASAGLKRDPKTKKVVGLEGFGHPMPFTRYRLVVTSVSNVEATERHP